MLYYKISLECQLKYRNLFQYILIKNIFHIKNKKTNKKILKYKI